MKPGYRLYLTFFSLSLLLYACGGGGGGGGGNPPPTLPAPSLSLASSRPGSLEFSWPRISGVTFYRLFENPDGVSGFTQVGGDLFQGGNVVQNTFIPVSAHLHDWANARYVLEACDFDGCSKPSNEVTTTSAMLSSIRYLKASNPDANDVFGKSLASASVSSSVVVGAEIEASAAKSVNFDKFGGDQFDNSAPGAGAAYLGSRYYKASNTEANDFFGSSVGYATTGDVAVGASGEDSATTGVTGANIDEADNSAPGAGAVYVYDDFITYFKASNTDAGDGFGTSLAFREDGATLAVGAPGEASTATGIDGNQADNSIVGAGAVYVFSKPGGWQQQAYIKASNSGTNDRFGESVALSTDGNTLVVGAPGEGSNATGINGNQADNSTNGSGAVYVFTRSGSTWSQQAYIKASNTGADDGFGAALAISGDGNTVVVGAEGEDSAATGVNGNQSDNSANGSGAAYVFTRTGSTWSQQAYIKASNTEMFDSFGSAVAISTDASTLAVGADGEASAAIGINGNQTDNSAFLAGAAYVFSNSGSGWAQTAYVKASNTEANDMFGHAVALNLDGSRLHVGAIFEASGSLSDQTDNSSPLAGAVYVY